MLSSWLLDYRNNFAQLALRLHNLVINTWCYYFFKYRILQHYYYSLSINLFFKILKIYFVFLFLYGKVLGTNTSLGIEYWYKNVDPYIIIYKISQLVYFKYSILTNHGHIISFTRLLIMFSKISCLMTSFKILKIKIK